MLWKKCSNLSAQVDFYSLHVAGKIK